VIERDVLLSNHIPRVCTYATFFSDEGLDITLTQSRDIATQLPAKIGDARIRLLGADKTTCIDTTINFDTENHFIPKTNIKNLPQPGDSITIIINATGFSQVEGKTRIPFSPAVESITATKFTSDREYYRFTVTFPDQASSDDYYLVSSVYDLITYTNISNKYDTTYQSTRQPVPLTDPVFSFMPDYRTSVKEPFIISELKPRIFPDDAFAGLNYGFRIEVPVRDDPGVNSNEETYSSFYNFELYTISEDCFEFLKTTYINKSIEGDIYAQPLFVTSNMTNRAGFFGAISKPSTAIQKIDDNDVLGFGQYAK